jgi:hypothetical protein
MSAGFGNFGTGWYPVNIMPDDHLVDTPKNHLFSAFVIHIPCPATAAGTGPGDGIVKREVEKQQTKKCDGCFFIFFGFFFRAFLTQLIRLPLSRIRLLAPVHKSSRQQISINRKGIPYMIMIPFFMRETPFHFF